MICHHCKEETTTLSLKTSKWVEYCGGCGEPITKKCPICGDFHYIGDVFCSVKGVSIPEHLEKKRLEEEDKQRSYENFKKRYDEAFEKVLEKGWIGRIYDQCFGFCVLFFCTFYILSIVLIMVLVRVYQVDLSSDLVGQLFWILVFDGVFLSTITGYIVFPYKMWNQVDIPIRIMAWGVDRDEWPSRWTRIDYIGEMAKKCRRDREHLC